MIFFDTETCGLHGPTVLVQWAVDDGPVELHNVWLTPIKDTLDLFKRFCEDPIVGFNLAFDWFHVNQSYNVLMKLINDGTCSPDDKPIEFVTEYALAESGARDGYCLKPRSCLDLFLHARKGPYQSTMDRSDIRIKRVPTDLAHPLAAELSARIPLKDVYFERKADKKQRWTVQDIEDDMGRIRMDVKDLLLKFAPSSGLKALAHDALELEEDVILKFTNVEPEKRPKELGYAPFATAIGEPGRWNNAWPIHISEHAYHWEYRSAARKYAEDDVTYTRWLYHFFAAKSEGYDDEEARKYALGWDWDLELPFDDDDSVLACMVGAVRWKGYKVDIERIKALREEARVKKDSAKYNFSSPAVCVAYLEECMDELEKLAIRIDGKASTKGIILEEIAKWKQQEVCNDCGGMGCENCQDGLVSGDEDHPAAARAQEILDYRHLGKRIELYDKLIVAGRFHASFKVIGTLSSRMAGGDGLNAQGIPHEKVIRDCFPLAFEDMELSGGDFDGFEVGIADAVYQDPELRKLLESGMKIHGLFGQELFQKSYEEIVATDGLPGEKNLYSRSKQGVFAILYGGEAYTLATRVGIPEEVGEVAYRNWCARFPVWGAARKKIFDKFCSMRQPNGIGTQVVWADPHDYAESMFGFRRYFTLENEIVKVLFDLANDPPKHLQGKAKVTRRDREQTTGGALRTACFAAAFGLQGSNMRQAANHEIQSTGAQTTKKLQVAIWVIQPDGVAEWQVIPMNIHDEVMTPHQKKHRERIEKIVDDFVVEYKDLIPLLGISWATKMKSWAQK